ncbi:sigma-70 family RNA polymerase sigma factor [Persicobacter diffluens]|uniref:DNA-directed RNA polymerase sigma-70 factor n=1 Tax=Persicobacter diffluens TaxID=981 RepID=A0AAN5AMH3_9BACT|nr:DNA-directed RNA polymerase sigma-70 factor [Persicobacter diffluens]
MGKHLLWEKIKSGDSAAYQQLFEEHVRLLYQYGHKICKESAVVEDAVQEIFVRIWEKREHLGETDNPKFYLMVALKRELYQRLKKRDYLQQDPQEHHFEVVFSVEEATILAEHQQLNLHKLKLAIQALRPRQRELIYHRFFMGLSYEETAEIMQMNYQSVRNLQSGALKQLKNDMGDIGLILTLITQIF